MAKKTWAERWGESPVDYTRSTEELKEELKKIRNLTARRAASLYRNNAFSYAEHALNENIQERYLLGKLPDVKKMTHRQVESELAIFHKFWSAKTSTLAGAKAEQREQSARIFGTDNRGRPRHIMTLEESREYWSLYSEFYNQYREGSAKYDSTRVQQVVGEIYTQYSQLVSNPTEFLARAREVLEEDFHANAIRLAEIMDSWGDREVYHSRGNGK